MVPAYGLNAESYKEETFAVDLPNSGLRLLMNAFQNESCAFDKFKRGAGYMFQIHDPNVVPLMLIDKVYYLSPGYHFDVAINRVLYNRKTEHLGYCASKRDMYMASFLHDQNVQAGCYVQCAAETLLKSCKCYPTPLIVGDSIIRQNAKRYNMNAKDVKFCWKMEDLKCMRDWRNVLFQESPKKLCPYCVQQCVEGRYKIQITKSQLSKRALGKFGAALSVEEIRKNYLSVHFYFSSMSILLIEESQAFTLKHMFIYIGSNIGLLLGMSFISPFEIIDFIFQLLHRACKYIGSRKTRGGRTKRTKVVPIQRGRIHTIVIKQRPVLRNRT